MSASEQMAKDRWPEVKLTRNPRSDRLRFAPATPAPGYEAMAGMMTETYLPSQVVRERLLSDEAVLAGAKRLFNREEPSVAQLWDVLKTLRAVATNSFPEKEGGCG